MFCINSIQITKSIKTWYCFLELTLVSVKQLFLDDFIYTLLKNIFFVLAFTYERWIFLNASNNFTSETCCLGQNIGVLEDNYWLLDILWYSDGRRTHMCDERNSNRRILFWRCQVRPHILYKYEIISIWIRKFLPT